MRGRPVHSGRGHATFHATLRAPFCQRFSSRPCLWHATDSARHGNSGRGPLGRPPFTPVLDRTHSWNPIFKLYTTGATATSEFEHSHSIGGWQGPLLPLTVHVSDARRRRSLSGLCDVSSFESGNGMQGRLNATNSSGGYHY